MYLPSPEHIGINAETVIEATAARNTAPMEAGAGTTVFFCPEGQTLSANAAYFTLRPLFYHFSDQKM